MRALLPLITAAVLLMTGCAQEKTAGMRDVLSISLSNADEVAANIRRALREHWKRISPV